MKTYLTFIFFQLLFSINAINCQVEEKQILSRPDPVLKAPPPPPPPPISPSYDTEYFKKVEDKDMPTFPGCESIGNRLERKKCADEKMLNFIYKNLKYPSTAKENGVEGIVVVRFIIEKDGSLSDIFVIQDIGAGCGEAAQEVVAKMPKWNPSLHRGRPLKILFNLPIEFKLQDNN